MKHGVNLNSDFCTSPFTGHRQKEAQSYPDGHPLAISESFHEGRQSSRCGTPCVSLMNR